MVKSCLFQNGCLEFTKLSGARVPALDAAYLFGDGVYEVIAVVKGQFFDLEPHLERLEKSLRAVLIEQPMPINKLAESLNKLLSKNTSGYVYMQVSRGTHIKRDFAIASETKSNFFAYFQEQQLFPQQNPDQGETSIIFPDIRWQLRQVKTTQLMVSRLAKKIAMEAGCVEPVYISANGTITEGGSSNIFIVKSGKISTHPADNAILWGVTRSRVIEIAGDVIERKFTLDELLTADEIFRTSTTQGVRGVTRIKIAPAHANIFADVPRESIWQPKLNQIATHKIGSGLVGAVTKNLSQKYVELATLKRNENIIKTA